MDVQLNRDFLRTSAVALQSAVAPLATAENVSQLPSLLSDKAVKISKANADLERLVALLTQETEEARENAVINIFANAYETVRNVNAAAADQDALILHDIGMATAETAEISTLIAEVQQLMDAHQMFLLLAGEIKKGATEEYEKFMATDYDPNNPESVAKKAEWEQTIADAEEAFRLGSELITALQELYDLAVGALDEKNAEVDAYIASLSHESYRALIEAASIKIKDLGYTTMPLTPEEESEKPAGTKAISDMTVSELIQYVRERDAQLLEDIEAKREMLV